MLPERKALLKALTFKTSRSGGKGGQNVNKVSSKVELILHISAAECFSPAQKMRLSEKLANRIDQEGNLHVISQEDRSQLQNKENSIAKLMVLLQDALHFPRVRKPVKTPKSVLLKRKSDKMTLSAKKQQRRRPDTGY